MCGHQRLGLAMLLGLIIGALVNISDLSGIASGVYAFLAIFATALFITNDPEKDNGKES